MHKQFVRSALSPRKNEPSRKPEMEEAMLEYVERALLDKAITKAADANAG